MSSSPQFSIIIPTFNARAKLEATLDSVRAQGFADLEILVQDGASTDGTRAFLAAQDDVNWQSEADRGVYDAMNRAMARARGRYFYFLGTGDLLRAGALAAVAAQLPAHDQGLLYGRVWWISEDEFYGTHFTALDLARRNISHQAAFYGRELFERSGAFDERYPVFADYALNIRLWRSASRQWLDLVVADYEGGGLSAQRRDPNFERDKVRLVWRHLGPLATATLCLDPWLSQGAKSLLRKLRHLRR